MASCADAYKPFDEGDGDIPTAKGSPATVGNAEFEGTLNNISLTGEGWTQEQVEGLIPVDPFFLIIQDSKLYLGSTIRGEQLLCPDSSNPNIIELSKETVLEDEDGSGQTIYTEYIKIILDNAASPTTAEIEYRFKLYVPAAGTPYSDTVIARYEGTINKKVASPGS